VLRSASSRGEAVDARVSVAGNSMEDTGRAGMAVAARCGARDEIAGHRRLWCSRRRCARHRPVLEVNTPVCRGQDCLVWRVRLGAVVPGVPRRRLVRGFGRLAETLRAIAWNVSGERAVCMPAMRAHLAVSASQSRTFCARRAGRRHRWWPETESPVMGGLLIWAASNARAVRSVPEITTSLYGSTRARTGKSSSGTGSSRSKSPAALNVPPEGSVRTRT
jgi:hypothetical protein